MSYTLQTSRLTKTIGGKELVNGVDMHVKKGEIYGFLGPNGAGKTTVMKMIMNLWKPTEGEIELFGKPLTPQSYEVFRRIGSMKICRFIVSTWAIISMGAWQRRWRCWISPKRRKSPSKTILWE